MKSLRIQSLTALVLASLSFLSSPMAAYSSLFGSLSVYLPGMFYTVLVMRKIGGDSAVFLRTAARAPIRKLVHTRFHCAGVFMLVNPRAAGFFFLGMIGVLIANWIGLGLTIKE
jgi:F0F1-type ATP synthase assembly protein I